MCIPRSGCIDFSPWTLPALYSGFVSGCALLGAFCELGSGDHGAGGELRAADEEADQYARPVAK